MAVDAARQTATIDKLIINSPYDEPAEHWRYHLETQKFSREPGRRPAGYIRATEKSKSYKDPGVFTELPLVNQIRPRVKAWREAGYAGTSGITKRLLEHWRDPEQRDYRRLFFCQLEAIETLIWLIEGPATERVGIEVPSDGGPFVRLCSKMATGSGKTIVMAMLIAWQVLNKGAYPQDKRFSKNIFVVAPGLTVKSRLQVLIPSAVGNYYQEFNLVPSGLEDKLRQGKVLIRNWHALGWESDEKIAKKKSVDKRGALSDEAYVREVLGDMADAQNIVVINDEAHHAWRVLPKSAMKELSKDEIEKATKWIGGLDRIHKVRKILTCFDLTATPFVPTGKKSTQETLYDWIVSDFGLNDAIESGLVKTPRVVIRDDGRYGPDYKSRLYHIYADRDVKSDISRKAEEHLPLPDLVVNGYYLLGKDWLETVARWKKDNFPTPPVMITVANRTETAARVHYALTHGKVRISALSAADKILHIDSKVLEKAEERDEAPEIETGRAEDNEDDGEADEAPTLKLSKKDRAEQLRQVVDTVGQTGKPGEHIQVVISVGMLSEGWDAKTVTHIMGLRAFTSQLLCEQVVGRGLRRTSYEVSDDGLFAPEYVNIFGVPFTFLPHESTGDGPPPPPEKPKFKIEPVAEKKQFEILWPNIIRIDHEYRPQLTLDLAKVKPLALDAMETATLAELAPMIDGKPHERERAEITLQDLARTFRMQKIIFETARDVYDVMRPTWRGNRESLLAQVIRITEQYITSGRIVISPPLFNDDDARRRIVLTLNMNRIVQHIWEAIRWENALTLAPIFDKERPIRATGDMQAWFTGKPCEHAKRSHVNMCVYDSRWEANEAFELDRNPNVDAWVKNDHLGFEILYTYRGVIHKYRPDFLVRLKNGKMLVLEVKGQDSQQNSTKREFLAEWAAAVNQHGGFGHWECDVSRHPKDIESILASHSRTVN